MLFYTIQACYVMHIYITQSYRDYGANKRITVLKDVCVRDDIVVRIVKNY